MRIRALLATAAVAASAFVALPATATVIEECPEGTFLAKYEDTEVRKGGDEIVSFTVTKAKSGGEILAVSWTSSEPISQIALKAGKETTIIAVDDATTGTAEVVGKYALSHITFCLGEDAPEITVAGRTRLVCWAAEEGGTFAATFAYNNVSTDEDGNPVDVDRTAAGFATSVPALADQFPTMFLNTGTDESGSAIEFTVSGWDGTTDLTFEAFGTAKTFKADPSWSMPSNECFDH